MTERDAVDAIIEQWTSARPDLDLAPMAVVGRISRLSRLLDRRIANNFANHVLEAWEFDVLATLRRATPAHELPAGSLARHTMVTTGAITHRVDRLEERGFVTRAQGSDRRVWLVRLTELGVRTVDQAVETHLDVERQSLSALTDEEQRELEAQLRRILVSLGDIADEPAP